jgi:hypothetical protein
MSIWIDLAIVLGAPLVRNIAGWVENSFKDGVVDKYEWGQLGSTIVRISVIGAGTYFGLNGLGIDVNVLGASAGAVVLDFILSSIKGKTPVIATISKK